MKFRARAFSITVYFFSFYNLYIDIFITFFSFAYISWPFIKLKDTIVTMSMASTSNKFFATWFVSRDEINAILSKNKLCCYKMTKKI